MNKLPNHTPNQAANQAANQAIVQYLLYLRDVSRKIVAHTGMEKIIIKPGKGSTNNPTQFTRQFVAWDERAHKANPLYAYYQSIAQHLDKNTDKRFFVGFGLLAGSITQKASYFDSNEQDTASIENKRKKNTDSPARSIQRWYAGPLLYAQADVSKSESFDGYDLELDLSTLSLNYDILAALSPNSLSSIDEDLSPNALQELETFEQLEKKMRTFFPAPNPLQNEYTLNRQLFEHHAQTVWQTQLNVYSEINFYFDFLIRFATELFNDFRSSVNTIQKIPDYKGGYHLTDEIEIWQKRKSKGQLISSVFENPLCFIESCHGYVAPIPDALSTYEALEQLAHQIATGNPMADNLRQLIGGILEPTKQISNTFDKHDKHELKLLPQQTEEEQEFENIPSLSPSVAREVIDNLLPFAFSNRQKQALLNAFESQISYIQGPPGTGKSFTIMSLALIAYLTGQKILIVSQKGVALKVLYQYIEPYLKTNTFPPPILYYDNKGRTETRELLRQLVMLAQNPTEIRQTITYSTREIEAIDAQLTQLRTQLESLKQKINQKRILEANFGWHFQGLIHQKQRFSQKYRLSHEPYKPNTQPIKPEFVNLENHSRYIFLAERFSELRQLSKWNLAVDLHWRKFHHHLIHDLQADPHLLKQYPNDYPSDFVNLQHTFTLQQKSHQMASNKGLGVTYLLHYEISDIQQQIQQLQKQRLRAFTNLQQAQLLKHHPTTRADAQSAHAIEVDKMDKMLHWRRASIINKRMQEIDYDALTTILPIWVTEIRNLGQILPMRAEIFDLVVVDEASQVNLSEILPVFYRGKRVVVVGDHAQLGLDSTGLNFQLSKKYDLLTWNRYKIAKIDYQTGINYNLTVSDASLLDFLRSNARIGHFPEQMLDEHYRSLPALAKYTAQYYNTKEQKIWIMSQNPSYETLPTHQVINVIDQRNENKIVAAEAQAVLSIIKSLAQQKCPPEVPLMQWLIDKHKDKQQNKTQNEHLSVGVVSMLRPYCEYLKELLTENIASDALEALDILVGTPEEFQGSERDIMLISLCLDVNATRSSGHYQNPQRMNVATSRAKYFTVLLYGGMPNNFNEWKKYERHFSFQSELANALAESSLSDAQNQPAPTKPENEIATALNTPTQQLGKYLKKWIQDQAPHLQIQKNYIISDHFTACWCIWNPENEKAMIIFWEGIAYPLASDKPQIHKSDAENEQLLHHQKLRDDLLTRIKKVASLEILFLSYSNWIENGYPITTITPQIEADIEFLHKNLNRLL